MNLSRIHLCQPKKIISRFSIMIGREVPCARFVEYLMYTTYLSNVRLPMSLKFETFLRRMLSFCVLNLVEPRFLACSENFIKLDPYQKVGSFLSWFDEKNFLEKIMKLMSLKYPVQLFRHKNNLWIQFNWESPYKNYFSILNSSYF